MVSKHKQSFAIVSTMQNGENSVRYLTHYLQPCKTTINHMCIKLYFDIHRKLSIMWLKSILIRIKIFFFFQSLFSANYEKGHSMRRRQFHKPCINTAKRRLECITSISQMLHKQKGTLSADTHFKKNSETINLNCQSIILMVFHIMRVKADL